LNSHKLDHSHKPDQLRQELVALLTNYNLKTDHISVAATPLATIATSATILTFLSIQLFLNSLNSGSRLLAGINVIFLLIMVFISLLLQMMIYRAKLRLAWVNHDIKAQGILECEDFTPEQHTYLIKMSHIAQKGSQMVDRIQWLYFHGLWRLLYAFLIVCVSLLILLILTEIPLRV
jgi:hypothetical protein